VIAPCEKGGTALTVLLEEHFANVRRSHEILFSLLQQLQQQGGSTFPTRWSGKFQSDPGYRCERTGGQWIRKFDATQPGSSHTPRAGSRPADHTRMQILSVRSPSKSMLPIAVTQVASSTP